MIRWLLLSIFSLLLLSCSSKEYRFKSSNLITIKSPELKHSDTGFVYRDSDRVKAEIYSLGQQILKIEINELTCVNENCMTHSLFNSRFLSKNYPDDTLKNILLGKEIFNGSGKTAVSGGFRQSVGTVSYSVVVDKIEFRDNSTLIKIEPLNR
jgi:hypothetical protein